MFSEPLRAGVETVGADNVFAREDASNKTLPNLAFVCARKSVPEIGKNQLTTCVGEFEGQCQSLSGRQASH
ncbi:MAG TPA: hypothetical protein VFD62_16420 [Pyrinomonadaceae bacterium]|nr:hypothetical protein [Pyrinomonadaceae bacterium]